MAENSHNKGSFQQDFSHATAVSGSGGAGGRGGDIGSHNTTTTNYFVRETGNKKVLEPLFQHIAPGALHNSSERFNAPKCHPHTREAIIQEIMEWTEKDVDQHPFLWVYGPAGTGKSSIAQSIAEILFKEGKVAASFFFSRTATGRNDASLFIPTLAYQLALNIPKMDGIVAKAVDHDPAIFSKSLDTQTEALIVEPLAQLSRSATAKDDSRQPQRKLVIIDGLDECGTPESQRLILTSLLAAIQKLPNQLAFLIASRPEYHIRSFFNDSFVHSISRSLVLDDRYQPDKDITLFLRSRFSDIKSNHPSGRFLPPDWPSESDINQLVRKASGQFIYASTMMKFVESARRLPVDQLNIILGLTPPGKSTPFAALDFLYTYVFESVDDNHIEKVMMVFVFILLKGVVDKFEPKPHLLEPFLCLQEGELHTLLIDLHSVISIPEVGKQYETLRLHHASLGDFLLDRARSGRFFIDVGQGHVQMAKYCMKQFVPQSDLTDARYFANCSLLYHCRNACPVQDLLEDLQEVDCEAYFDIHGAIPGDPREHSGYIDTIFIHFPAWIRDIELKYFPEKEIGLHAKYLAYLDRNVQARFARYPSGSMVYHLATAATLSFPASLTPNYIFRNLIFGLQPPVHNLSDYEKVDFDACYFNGFRRLKGFENLLAEVLKDESRSGAYHVNSGSYRNLAQFCITVLQFSWFRSEKPILPDDIKELRKFKLKNFETFYFDLLLSTLAADPLDPELAKYLRDNPIPKDSIHFNGKKRTDALQVIQSYIKECEKNPSNKDLSSLQESSTTASVDDIPDNAIPPSNPLSEGPPTTVVGDDHLLLTNQVTSIPLRGDSRVPSEEPITVVSEGSKGGSNEDRDQAVAISKRQGTESKKDEQGLGDDLEEKRRNLEDLERRLCDWEDKLGEREKAFDQKEKQAEERERLAKNSHAPLLLSNAPSPDYDTFDFATSVAWPGAVATILRGQSGLGKAIKKKHQALMDDWINTRGDNLSSDSYDCLLYSHGVAWPKAILDSTADENFLLIRTKFLNLMNVEGYHF